MYVNLEMSTRRRVAVIPNGVPFGSDVKQGSRQVQLSSLDTFTKCHGPNENIPDMLHELLVRMQTLVSLPSATHGKKRTRVD